jgi:hypothetical protein
VKSSPAVRNKVVLGVVVVCWAALVTAGLGRLWTYAMTPGPAADARAQWPADSRVSREPGRPTLVVLLHPQCTCSEATVGELARLIAHAPHGVTVHALIYQPSDMGQDWGGTSLRDQARAIPGVLVSSDVDGNEARRFGGYVSGQTFLYDERGALAFSGGITFARGHSGDNAGVAAIEALLRGDAPKTHRTPVFGCLIGQSWEASS